MGLYLFYGTEGYLVEQEIYKLINKLVPEAERNLNVISYDLTVTTIEEIIEDAETPAFFSTHKVIIGKNAFFFTGQKNPKGIEHRLEILENFMDLPSEFSTIIFYVQAEKLDERKKIVKKIKSVGKVKSFMPLTGNPLLDWVKEKVKEEKATIADDAAKSLIYIVGQDLQILTQEIKKMAIYVGENNSIDKSVVDELTTRTSEQNVFALIDKVANLDFEHALQMFYDLLKNKEEPIKMVALLARQFRFMLYSKELNRIGYTTQQIASNLGAHPFTIQIALKQSDKFSEEQLKKIIAKLSEVDFSIKTGQMDKVLSLEMFMFYLKGLVRPEKIQTK